MMFLIREKLWDKVTEGEKMLFRKSPLGEDDLTTILWRAESIWLLLWVINQVDQLELPETEVDLNEIFPRLPGFFDDTADFINSATIRNISEIMDQSDLIFRLNWALRQTHLEGSRALTFSPGIAYERYFSLNWVTGAIAEWDE
jgi:hypothetical protein